MSVGVGQRTAVKVLLNEAEQRIALWVAKKRMSENKSANVVDRKMGPQDDEDANRNGFGAELAFCKMFNVYPDFSTQPRSGSSDCERFGQSVDVKSTTYPNGRLVAIPRKKELASDMYALLVCVWPEYTFVGFASAAELLSEKRLTDLGHGPTYAMNQDELTERQTDDHRWCS